MKKREQVSKRRVETRSNEKSARTEGEKRHEGGMGKASMPWSVGVLASDRELYRVDRSGLS